MCVRVESKHAGPTVLEHGLPADNGIRPHINITVDAETLKAMADDQARKTLDLDLKPATLDGFGPIGPGLLAHLLCGAEVTPFLITTIGKNIEVLDVGRTERLATPRQAKAISLQTTAASAQHPPAATPSAHNHHLTWWSHGGRTDLDNLIGLCRTCHTLVHSGRLDLARGSPHQTLAA